MAVSYSKTVSKILEIITQLDRKGTIPSKYREAFNDRIYLTFAPFRFARGSHREEQKTYTNRYRQKKAQKVYLEILNETPNIYIGFILAVSPTACRTFDLLSFQEQYHQQSQRPKDPEFSSDTHQLLRKISENHGFDQNEGFRKLISLLFPEDLATKEDPPPKPISAAESERYFSYESANTNTAPYIFGRLYEFVEGAPARVLEKSTVVLPVTECIRTIFAQDCQADGVVSLDIGRADELAKVLFPHVNLELSEAYTDGHTKDNAYFSFIGASIQAIMSLFPARILGAIEASDLRAWEKEHFLLETTDCVTMRVFREKPHCGTISLRIGYGAGFPILVDLNK